MFKKKKIRRSREFNKNNKLIDFEKAKTVRKEKRDALIQAELLKRGEEETSQRKLSKKARKRNFYAAAIIVIIAIVCVSAYNIHSVHRDYNEATASRDILQAEIESLEQRLQYVHSPEYIEQRARRNLRMVMPGEILFIMPDPDDERQY